MNNKGMKIYIAGPYTKGDQAENVRNAIYAGSFIGNLGHFPFIPHLSHFWHMMIPENYEYWLRQDEEWLKCCDGLLRLPGESAGADREVELAKALGIPIYTSVFDIPRIAK